MITAEGPLQRKKQIFEIRKRIDKLRIYYLILFLILPFMVFMPLKYRWINIGTTKSAELGTVALVQFGDGTGSAFLISPTKLITAKHVVEGAELNEIVRLTFEKSSPKIEVDAKVSFVSSNNPNEDYAILELIKPLNDHPILELGDMNDVEINDEVTIIGYPGGIFTSAKAQIVNNDISEMDGLFILNGGAWPGNSGGPIIHKKTGAVVGILIAGFEGRYKGMVIGQKINVIKKDKRLVL
jgi:S1-C subfamily serine protease